MGGKVNPAPHSDVKSSPSCGLPSFAYSELCHVHVTRFWSARRITMEKMETRSGSTVQELERRPRLRPNQAPKLVHATKTPPLPPTWMGGRRACISRSRQEMIATAYLYSASATSGLRGRRKE